MSLAGVLGSSPGLSCRWLKLFEELQGPGNTAPNRSHPSGRLNLTLCWLAPVFQEFVRMFLYTCFLFFYDKYCF